MSPRRLTDFALLFHNAAEKGLLLLFACILAILLANSSLQSWYFSVIESQYCILNIEFSFIHFVNDFLMVLFFLVVGLEIKREMVEGHLATKAQRVLPIIAACGGVLCPVLIYYAFNFSDPISTRGWAIPAATDIAFALGMLALLGKGLPTSLRVFLTALAIIDDLIAVVIIALFYSTDLALEYFLNIGVIIAVLYLLCCNGFGRLYVYVLLGVMLWYFFIKSGIHATVAGVTLGMLIPVSTSGGKYSPLKKLEKSLHPFISYLILPIFAFTNSGVDLSDFSRENLFHGSTMGIIIGLFIGKQLGVFATTWTLIKIKLSKLPEGTTYMQFYGVSILCGIGFTMSLFVDNLAFATAPDFLNEAKAGILIGSLLSAVYGGIIIWITKNKAN